MSNGAVSRWGSAELRRTTLALAVTQVVSWGVLFYGFAVVSPEIATETGWGGTAVSGAFTAGLLVSGFAAPWIARALAEHGARVVLTAGSVLGMIGMLAFAVASHLVILYGAWILIGLAMAATLYEPAMAVLVALDPTRTEHTLTVVAIAGGLACSIFAPLAGWLTEWVGWREAVAILAVGGGGVTALIHSMALPSGNARTVMQRLPGGRARTLDRPLRGLQVAMFLEQAAIVATTVCLVGLLADRDVELSAAAGILSAMGLGKIAGRLLVLRLRGRHGLVILAAGANILQSAGLALPLLSTAGAVLVPAMALVGAAAGAATVVRPLLVIDLVGPGPFAATSARLQRSSTIARAAAPFGLAAGASTIGWSLAWAGTLMFFLVAACLYPAFSRHPRGQGTSAEPDPATGVHVSATG